MPDDAALLAAIEAALLEDGCAPAHLSRVVRQPVIESASHHLERVDAVADDGRTASFALKHVGPAGLLDAARRNRPSLAKDWRLEGEVYRLLNTTGMTGVPRLRAEVQGWLLNDWVDGTQLWRLADLDCWLETARWAARLHRRVGLSPAPGPSPVRRGGEPEGASGSPPSRMGKGPGAGDLPVHDAVWYRAWAQRAATLAAARPPTDRAAIQRIIGQHERIVERLLGLPRALIHGELFPANILMTGGPGNWLPVVVDWESAAIGCRLTDLACLTAGGWTVDERAGIVVAYFEELRKGGSPLPCWNTLADLTVDLAWCRLQLAVQWLGWSATHDGPPEQVNDWLREATVLADSLGL